MTSTATSPAGRRLVVEPFDGTVTATFSDAVIASTDAFNGTIPPAHV